MGLRAYLDGILGENKACEFLVKNHFEIVERNFHSKFGEIDIIARKNGILHFIEVKFTTKDYEASERLNKSKYEKILKTIEFYTLKNEISQDFQIDLITIRKNLVEFYENISLF